VHTDPEAAFNTSARRPWDPPIPLPDMDLRINYDLVPITDIIFDYGNINVNDFVMLIYPIPW
jgi:hypothetical protein